MRRLPMTERTNLGDRCKELSFDFSWVDGAPYWDETACYAFTLTEVEDWIEDPSAELAGLSSDLADRIIRDEKMMQQLHIPQPAWDLVANSWRNREPSLYGRFDLAFDGTGPAKMLEYNADTPTALFESAVFQWVWLEDCIASGALPAAADQFNSIHETLIERLREIKTGNTGRFRSDDSKAGALSIQTLHIACDLNNVEDCGFASYLADCASQAGFVCTILDIGDIGIDPRASGAATFVDRDVNPIKRLFKLYPWEWMFKDDFGSSPAMRTTTFMEPPWKAVLSSKALLPLLWERHPGHPNLLPSFFEDDPKRLELGASYASKPLYSREGSNITLTLAGETLDSDAGPYGGEGYIWQALAPMPEFDGNFPVIGSWIIGEKACGMGVREDVSRITKNTSRFVPHIILDD
jgi:glutathionylspermidine synthase